MPIYEYRCQDCGASFEKLVRTSEVGQVACPGCGKNHLKQEFSVFAAHGAGESGPKGEAMPGGCGEGMCRMPDVCGRN
jgi:putative FmdB family regulatory protein